jgi:2-C-methyl-D-erythritol 2,4-cyclodiphosphate synthase
MRKNIASVLEINSQQVNIKATTTERLGSIGRGQAISSYAIVLLEEKND